MALARQPAPPSPCLAPADNAQFRNELTACLALTVPVGMTEEARREWLAVAWATLKHLPADLLASGCEEARRKADHPAKIVPIIIASTSDRLRSRRDNLATDAPRLAAPKPDYVTADQAAEILAEYGLGRG